jgi:uncharacterized lipoprotein YddW (UPF0748 family)
VVSRDHVSLKRPHLVRSYGRQLWLDPGEREVQDYSRSVIMDVVKRYDIDGVHLDDYFYPYKEQDASGKAIEFPDVRSWQKYGVRSGLSRNDWRRRNVDQFVEQTYKAIKAAKPWVRFGISPFGIWRPNQPEQIRGLDAWSDLYADARKWLVNGWGDYFAPQLYWAIEPPQQSFPVLLRWWAAQNPKGRLLLAGMDDTKVGRSWKPDEILRQIAITRKQPGTSGHVHWNMKSLMRRPDLNEALLREAYQGPAVTPALPWLSSKPPAAPELRIAGTKQLGATWKDIDASKISVWVLHTKTGQVWQTRILPRTQRSYVFDKALPDVIALTAVNRFGIASPASSWSRTK